MQISNKAIERATNRYPKLPPRAALVAEFIEIYCTVTGEGGKRVPFALMPWQLEVLEGIYTGYPGDIREITRALISMARKNGKTELCSGLVLVHLCGPEAPVGGGQIICAAAMSQDQAGLSMTGAKEMAQSNPTLNRHMTYRENRLIWKADKIGNYAKTISKSASSAQGLRPSFFVYDEIAETTDRTHWEALNLAQTDDKIGGLGIIISTKSNKPNSLFTVIHDEIVTGQQSGINKHWICKVWAADPKADNPYTMEQVAAANPALDIIVPSKMIEQELENAIHNPSARPEFKARRLNLHSGTNASLVDPTIWADAADPDGPVPTEVLYERMAGKKVVLGIDLGSTTSMTSVALYWPTENYICAKNWMAGRQVQNNETLHKVPYGAWAEAGYLTLIEDQHHGGMTYEPIAQHIVDIFDRFEVISFRYDGWNMARLFEIMKNLGLDREQEPLSSVLDKFVQGLISYGEAIVEFEDSMFNGTLMHDGNPCTNMSVNVCEVSVKNRATEELRVPVKNTKALPNDAAVAILMAHSKRNVDLTDRGVDKDFIERFYSIGA